jgi:hypothetical protein
MTQEDLMMKPEAEVRMAAAKGTTTTTTTTKMTTMMRMVVVAGPELRIEEAFVYRDLSWTVQGWTY